MTAMDVSFANLRRLNRLSPAYKLCLAIVCFYALVVVVGPFFAPYGEAETVGQAYQPWSSQFLLGTDSLGRDVLSRMIYGARNTIGIAVTISIISFVVGVSAGLWAAVSGGAVDQLISRIVDIAIAIPKLIFALLILSIAGTSITSLILTVALLDAPRMFRVARAAGNNVLAMDFIEVARLRKENRFWILLNDVLPNIWPVILAEFGQRFSYVFIFISALGFLGLGIQPPAADWGTMVRENAALIAFGSMAPILPAVAISLLTLSVNFLIDAFSEDESIANE
jgi:peptide/nickel transport system permease protein